MCRLRELVKTSGCLVLMLVLDRGDALVQGQYGCCSEEVVGCVCCRSLKVVVVYGAHVLGGVYFLEVLAGYCWYLRE